MSFARRLCGFLRWARQNGQTTHTCKAYASYARTFERYLQAQGIEDPREVTAKTVSDFQSHLVTVKSRRGRPYTARSRALVLAWLRKFFFYLQVRGLILIDPTRGIRLPRIGRRLPRVLLTAAEMRLLLFAPDTRSALGLRDRAILEVFYGTGLRFGELADLTTGDLDLEERTLWVRRGKGQKDRLVPLGRWATYWLKRHLATAQGVDRWRGENRVFLGQRGNRLDNSTLNELIRAYARQVGLDKPISAHAFRHAYATHLIKGGADVRHIQRLLGHEVLTTTALYTQLDVNDLRRTQERCHPREKRRQRRTGRG